MAIKHSVVSALPNDPTKEVSSNAWNDSHSISGDIEVPSATYGVVLRAPDNSRWRITVDNDGALIGEKL